MTEARPPDDLWCVRTFRPKGSFTEYKYFESQSYVEYFLFKCASDKRTKYNEDRVEATHVWHLDLEYGWIPWRYDLEPLFRVSGPPVEQEE